MSRFKFRTQLVIYFFITIIFVVVSMFVSLFASFKDSYRDKEKEMLENQAKQAVMNIENRLDYYRGFLELWLEDDRFTGTFSTQRLEKILKFFEISTGIRWRYLNNPDLGQEKLNIEIY